MTDSSEHEKFWNSLDRWHQVVECVLRKGRAPLGITNEIYVQIHKDLLNHVQHMFSDPSTQLGQIRQSLQHTVRPWVNLDSLTHSDKRVLRMLESDVRQIRNRLMPRQYWHWRIFQRLAIALFIVTGVVIMLGLFGTGDSQPLPASSFLATVWDFVLGVKAQIWHGIVRSTTNERLIALAVFIVLVGMFFLRSPKTS